ncbi:MAG TPA: energy transducer TonB [Caulobacteraceae bacterium]|jgi:tetratricopeptide (TPR) repeat protein
MADPPAAPATRSKQAIYNEGQAAYDASDWDKAIADFSAVLADVQSDSRSDAIIRIRLADALVDVGRLDEAQAQAARAVAALRPMARGADADLADAYLTLADSLRVGLDYDGAIDNFKLAAANAAGADAAEQALEAKIGLIQASVVTQPEQAAATLDAMLADQAALKAQPKIWQAQLYSLRARAELNRGDPMKALGFIKQAMELSGGLNGSKVSLAQVAIRGDAALIYSALREPDNTREYLAYTGAGRLPDNFWMTGAALDPPVCGPEIAPEDNAVVEFAIAADGRTAAVAPVWSSRPGDTGLAFARAVRDWRWRPEAIAKLDGFWRQSVRVELRCATRPPALELKEPFEKVTRDWLAAHGDSEELYDIGPKALAASNAAPPADMARITALFRQISRETSASKAVAEVSQLDAMLVQAGAPVEARALAIDMGAANEGGGGMNSWASGRVAALNTALPRLDTATGGQRSAAWLRVELAVALETVGNFSGARNLLDAVVALPPDVLAADDPIRSVAVLHLSLIDKREGKPLAARSRLVAAGLTSQKCDLLDVKPIATSGYTNSSEFPDEAQRWGFEGWVEAGFDIGADGDVKGVRALISYPPFVFDDATDKVVSTLRYLPPTLGDTALGCTGQTIRVDYRLPGVR